MAPAHHQVIGPEQEEQLADTALNPAAATRDTPAAARHHIRSLDRLELEQLACVLAAFVPPNRAPHGLLRQLAIDIRNDLGSAHRCVRYMARVELERVCLALAEVVPDDVPVGELAWWRTLAPAVCNGSEAA